MVVKDSPIEHLVCCRPLPGVREPSDAAVVVEGRQGLLVALIDGAGQGAAVSAASQAAARVVAKLAAASVAELFLAAHRALEGSQGASMALFRIPARRRAILFAGIGRVYGAIAGNELTVLASEPGRVGVGLPRIPAIQERVWHPGSVAALAADGLVDVWDLASLDRIAEIPLSRVAERLGGVPGRLPDDASLVLVRSR